MTTIEQMGQKAKEASLELAVAGSLKNKGLLSIANAIINNTDKIVKANKIDLDEGKKSGLTTALLERLTLNEERIQGMAKGIQQIVALQDPIGTILKGSKMENGLEISKVQVPLGVIGIIYESRPNVTSDAAALCLKAGNAVILRGGKEAINSNMVIAKIMRNALDKAGLNKNCVQLIEDTTRESTNELMRLSDYLDVLIPRGGAGLIKAVVENSTVPVIETGSGNCHTYIDDSANLDMATKIAYNAKTSRPSVCNAMETLLVHKNIAKEFLPKVKTELDKANIKLIGCEKTIDILSDSVILATEEDYFSEFLDYILAIKIVDSTKDAISHINKYGSGHSDCIVTKDYENSQDFTNQVNSSSVYVNSSTRFTDGGEFGLGAEIGISTQKLHARGPMGLNELTSYKYVIRGNGQIRE